MSAYGTIAVRVGEETRKVAVSFLKVEPEPLVDKKAIAMKDANGNPITSVRKVILPDGKPYYIDHESRVYTNGKTLSDGSMEEISKDAIRYFQRNDDGKEEEVTEYEATLKKGTTADFTKRIPLSEVDNFYWEDMYEVTASEDDMWDLWQVAKDLADRKEAAICPEVVMRKGWTVTGGIITASVDEQKRTFRMVFKRVSSRIEPTVVMPIPTGPTIGAKKDKKTTAKAKTKSVF